MESTLAIQLIPVSRIKANAENPRHVIAQGMVDNLAKSVQSAGLKNPIKVQRLKGKKAEGAKTFPGGEAEMEKGEKTITGPENGFEYELVSRHIRLEAAKSLDGRPFPPL